MYISIKKYHSLKKKIKELKKQVNSLTEERNKIFLIEADTRHDLTKQIHEANKQAYKYKQMYLDEVDKRLNLIEMFENKEV